MVMFYTSQNLGLAGINTTNHMRQTREEQDLRSFPQIIYFIYTSLFIPLKPLIAMKPRQTNFTKIWIHVYQASLGLPDTYAAKTDPLAHFSK